MVSFQIDGGSTSPSCHPGACGAGGVTVKRVRRLREQRATAQQAATERELAELEAARAVRHVERDASLDEIAAARLELEVDGRSASAPLGHHASRVVCVFMCVCACVCVCFVCVRARVCVRVFVCLFV